MSTTSLEKRVADLEARYAHLLQLVQARPSQNNWRASIGMFADDPLIDELHAEVKRIRDEDRAAARNGDL